MAVNMRKIADSMLNLRLLLFLKSYRIGIWGYAPYSAPGSGEKEYCEGGIQWII